MDWQTPFSDLEMLAGRPRATRRARFLSELYAACPWGGWEALVAGARRADAERRGVRPGTGRPCVDDSTMRRMYMLQICFGLSDLACEEQVWDSAAIRRFVGVAPEGVPDTTTLCKFRHLLEESGIGARMLDAVAESAADRGLQMSRGTIVDATFVESPSSTKNSAGKRDPRCAPGEEGPELTLRVQARHRGGCGGRRPPQRAHRRGRRPRPGPAAGPREGGRRGGQGRCRHVGAEGRAASDVGLAGITWHVAKRRSALSEEDLPLESAKTAVRCAAGHVFHILKDTSGIRRMRLKGLAKVSDFLAAAIAAAGALMARRGLRPFGPPAALSAANQEVKLERFRGRTRRKTEREAGKAAAGTAAT